MDMGYTFYMAEAEGLLPTRVGKLNAIIKDVKKYPKRVMEESVFIQTCAKHGINHKTLTKRELQYINKNI